MHLPRRIHNPLMMLNIASLTLLSVTATPVQADAWSRAFGNVYAERLETLVRKSDQTRRMACPEYPSGKSGSDPDEGLTHTGPCIRTSVRMETENHRTYMLHMHSRVVHDGNRAYAVAIQEFNAPLWADAEITPRMSVKMFIGYPRDRFLRFGELQSFRAGLFRRYRYFETEISDYPDVRCLFVFRRRDDTTAFNALTCSESPFDLQVIKDVVRKIDV